VGALDATGGNTWVTEKFLSRPKSVTGALLKMMLPVSFVSAFMNNTPVVAMFLPAVNDWAKQHRIAPSKLMIPLSYAAVLSGIVTMIGTSTNLLVNGMFIANTGRSLHMFQLTGVGIPICLAGIAFVLLFHRWLLPARQGSTQAFGDPREYTVEMLVERGSPLAGKTIEQAGLRQLPNAYVAEIERDGDVIPAVGPEDRLHVGDRLVFVGVVDAVLDLQKIRGLKPATNQIFKLDGPRSQRCLIEAVVSERCPIAGLTIREGRFRSRYNAAVIAVARSGERINRKIGDIVLRAGDTLLLEAHPSFGEQHRNSRDFYLVSQVANSTPRRHERALLAVGILIAMIVVASVGWLSMLKAALLAAGAMIFTRCCSARIARDSVEWKVIFTVAAAFALGTAVQTSGLAHALAESITGFARGSPRGTLVAIYGATLVLTELVSHGAAVSLIFPIALQASAHLGLDCLPFVAAVTIAGSLGFATPLGYQTHMMVYGPGGYRFSDFLRIGIPLDILCWALAVVLIPIVIPFRPAG
jgi:di/tricarboxylate transporter